MIRRRAPGSIFYVVGPSGAGKDTVINLARRQCPPEAALTFAHRYITRPPDSSGENHIFLTEQEFERRENYGCFALTWQANGLRYGIGVEVDAWLQKGLNVVVSGSREHVAALRRRYPSARLIRITAPEHVLRVRLLGRGREPIDEVERRLERARLYDVERSSVDLDLVNDADPETTAGYLLHHMLESSIARLF